MPGVSKVTLKESPDARSPESNSPSSAVTVWETAPSFDQVTVEPTTTVIVAEQNAKSTMLTDESCAPAGELPENNADASVVSRARVDLR